MKNYIGKSGRYIGPRPGFILYDFVVKSQEMKEETLILTILQTPHNGSLQQEEIKRPIKGLHFN